MEHFEKGSKKSRKIRIFAKISISVIHIVYYRTIFALEIEN